VDEADWRETCWKPASNSMLIFKLQFLRESAGLISGPVWTMYWEKVISISVLVASTCTSVLPGGQPEPSKESPTTRTCSEAGPGGSETIVGLTEVAVPRILRI